MNDFQYNWDTTSQTNNYNYINFVDPLRRLKCCFVFDRLIWLPSVSNYDWIIKLSLLVVPSLWHVSWLVVDSGGHFCIYHDFMIMQWYPVWFDWRVPSPAMRFTGARRVNVSMKNSLLWELAVSTLWMWGLCGSSQRYQRRMSINTWIAYVTTWWHVAIPNK